MGVIIEAGILAALLWLCVQVRRLLPQPAKKEPPPVAFVAPEVEENPWAEVNPEFAEWYHEQRARWTENPYDDSIDPDFHEVQNGTARGTALLRDAGWPLEGVKHAD